MKWNNKENGKAITRYINTMAKKYPKVAKKVLRHGIGDLNHWFSNKRGRAIQNIKTAKCGCMVGTTALIAMEVNPQACQLVLKDKYIVKDEAPELLYKFIKASEGKYDPDSDEWFENDDLYKCIEKAGFAAADETDVPWGEGEYPWSGDLTEKEQDVFRKLRHQEVINHIEFLFKKKLGLIKPTKKLVVGKKKYGRRSMKRATT